MIHIANDGQAVVSTSYWSTPHADAGYLYVSINAGAIRVLVPAATAYLLDELPPAGCADMQHHPAGRPSGPARH